MPLRTVFSACLPRSGFGAWSGPGPGPGLGPWSDPWSGWHGRLARAAIACAVAGPLAAPAFAQPDPSGIEFVTITHPGNAAWAGNGTEGDMAIGRGSVGYEYRIGKYEVTTAQWVEFFNAAYDRADAPLPHLLPPTFWGASPTTPNNPGRQRWTVPAGNEMMPVGDISWRMAAMYCNWLHNDKSLDRAAFLNGAYDVSTFGFVGQSGIFTDQLTHHPTARFWIPTWDEWLKAAHYDPNKVNGDGTIGGWWIFPHGSDTRPRYGPPGVLVTSFGATGPDPNGVFAQANADWTGSLFPGHNPFTVPLGAYPTVQSPWGLLDVAGGTSEWTEFTFLTQGVWPTGRGAEGSAWTNSWGGDWLYTTGAGDFPNTATFDYGLRIAGVVPSPGACFCLMACGIFMSGSRTRKGVTHEARDRVRHVRGSWGGMTYSTATAIGCLMCITNGALAQPDPSGIEFVTITHPGNAAYQSINPNDFVNGRGGVDYEYRIGKYEVTTAQWVEFFNAAYDRADAPLPHLLPPDFWGAAGTTPNNPGRQRWTVPAGNEMRPVGDISWRMAAMFCNWLHNGKSSDRNAFLSGAYDVSTFGFNGGIFTDQLVHSPGATYWIPTWDEWLKAAHYDPNKVNGDGTTGGWWQYSNGSDTAYIYGPPPSMGGTGQANAGFTSPSPFTIPLGSYATVSPWGLYDMAGGTTEWTESVRTLIGGERYRVFDGSHWGQNAFVSSLVDQAREWGGEFPHIPTYEFGLRVASSIPAPGPWAVGVGAFSTIGLRRKRGWSWRSSRRLRSQC